MTRAVIAQPQCGLCEAYSPFASKCFRTIDDGRSHCTVCHRTWDTKELPTGDHHDLHPEGRKLIVTPEEAPELAKQADNARWGDPYAGVKVILVKEPHVCCSCTDDGEACCDHPEET